MCIDLASTLLQTFMKCLCEVVPQLLGGTINSEAVFPWRCFLMDANVSLERLHKRPERKARQT